MSIINPQQKQQIYFRKILVYFTIIYILKPLYLYNYFNIWMIPSSYK